MDRQEFARWTEVTEMSKARWVLDQVTLHNQNIVFLYRGGVDGIYFRADRHGNAEIGFYEGAIPHIGDAMFQIVFSNKIATNAHDALFKVGVRYPTWNLPQLEA